MQNFCRGFLVVLICACAALLHGSTSAAAGTHLALVLGNSKYQAAPALDNPANDAEDFAKAIRNAGQLRLQAAEIDPESQDPVVPKNIAPQSAYPHTVAHRRIVRFQYRFTGCSWVYC